jgi:Domain of unknown function (DUF2017)
LGDDGAGHLNTPEWQLPLRRSAPGCYEVSLSAENRELLRTLPSQLRAAIAANPKDAVFRRLFPPAYANDEMAEQEYRRLVGPDLDESRSLAFETLSKTADAKELSEEELDAWVRALNDIRLWLGTLLDVSEDQTEDGPDDPPHLLYHLLTEIQGLAVEALLGGE